MGKEDAGRGRMMAVVPAQLQDVRWGAWLMVKDRGLAASLFTISPLYSGCDVEELGSYIGVAFWRILPHSKGRAQEQGARAEDSPW